MLYGHGNDAYSYKTKIKADFSSNVWYESITQELFYVLQQNLPSIASYPEPDAGSLKIKIARLYNIKSENILITNGSTEAFYYIAQVFENQSSVIIYPSFSEYEDACKMFHHKLTFLDNKADWLNLKFNNAIVWFGNPNNPDGKTISFNKIQKLLERNPNSYFIIDEAYAELCYGFESSVMLLQKFANFIIVQSFTKTFSVPGLRLGYIISSKEIIKKISILLKPWSVNSLAISAGHYILDCYKKLLPQKKLIRKQSHELQKRLNEMSGLEVYPSNCNYFLAKSHYKTASDLKDYLVKNCGLLIRDASNFRGLDTSFFRVAIQQQKFNSLLLKGIGQWLQC